MKPGHKYYHIDALISLWEKHSITQQDLLKWGADGELQFSVLTNKDIEEICIRHFFEKNGRRTEIGEEIRLKGPGIRLPLTNDVIRDLLFRPSAKVRLKPLPRIDNGENSQPTNTQKNIQVDYQVTYDRFTELHRAEVKERRGEEDALSDDWVCSLKDIVIDYNEVERFGIFFNKNAPSKKQLTTKEKNNLLRLIGALIEIHYSTSDYLKGEDNEKGFNASIIADEIIVKLNDKQFNTVGISEESIRKVIPKAIEEIEKNKI